MRNDRPTRCYFFLSLLALCSLTLSAAVARGQGLPLHISIDRLTGSYTIGADPLKPVLQAGSAVKVNGQWLRASDYPSHIVGHESSSGELGAAEEWTVRYTGRPGAPDLVVHLRAYQRSPFGDIQVAVQNTTGGSLNVQAIRVIDATGEVLDIGGPAREDRVLSDSLSEDRPAMQIRDLGNADHQVHRAVGSQLVYNRQSHRSWFIGALTSDKFLSVLRLHMSAVDPNKITSYQIDCTGTTELLEENSLKTSSLKDRIELSIPIAAGAELSSERMLFSVAKEYHEQLETYAHIVRALHHARTSAPTPLGWWSWTAYYFGLNEGAALTNAEWLAQHLKSYGYDFFHIDEGYQFARGEYTTPDATHFPHGLAALERSVMAEGLTPGIWTAPFEVSERSWVFNHHSDWLVNNAQGQPIHIGLVADNKEHLYALDPTNPGAQAYLRSTYATLTKEWGIRYIKLDFMEDSAVEGVHYRANTTALEAQRIGLRTIRDAVGDKVLLDKDGSEMLNPVGIVDMGRISQDTGHTFSSSRDAASGIAARYYMNRNYFVADPDAFTVSRQTIDDQDWHGGSRPLTLDEAKVSIALAAVSGGMFEDGDDLPTLQGSPDRVALLENRTLLDMVHLGRASTPVDLMSYEPEDLQPSLFALKEDDRQTIVTIFNWTESTRSHQVLLADVGLDPKQHYTMTDALDSSAHATALGQALEITQPAHSVRVLRIVDTGILLHSPTAKATVPSNSIVGTSLAFSAEPATPQDAIVGYRWDFGDGVAMEGCNISHTFTSDGTFTVTLTVTGLEGTLKRSSYQVKVTGAISTQFHPELQRRLESNP